MADRLRITLVKSPIGHKRPARATLRALGLNRMGQTIVIDDTPQLRGMANAIRFLVRTEPVEAKAEGAATGGGRPKGQKTEKTEATDQKEEAQP